MSVFKSEEGKTEIINFYNQLLDEWSKPNERFYVETQFGKTFVIRSGVKGREPVILLHGSAGNSAMWISEAARLSKQYNVFSIDIVGECGKSKEYRPEFSEKSYNKWLHDVMKALHLTRVNLVGCSLGGWIAAEYAAAFPGMVNSLVLISTGGITEVKSSALFRLLFYAVLGKAGQAKTERLIFHNLEIDFRTRQFGRLTGKYFNPIRKSLPVITDEKLLRLHMPVLFLGGDKDCFYNSVKTARRLESLLSHFKYHVFVDSGHVLVDLHKHIIPFFRNLAPTKTNENNFTGLLGKLIEKGKQGKARDVDHIMQYLTRDTSLADTRFVDFALSQVEHYEGVERLKYYLFEGSLIQRNYTSLYFSRRGEWKVIYHAFNRGKIDEIQAFAR